MHFRVGSVALAGTLLAATIGAVGGSAQAAPQAAHVKAQQDGWTVVVRGLNNPRQLSVTPMGSLLVAEAGVGGSHCVPGEEGGETCVGATGSISWVPLPSMTRQSDPIRVVTGLPSLAGPAGAAASGPSSVAAGRHGEIYLGLAGLPPEAIPPDLDTSLLGKLARARLPHTPRPIADLFEFETVHDPDQQGVESNPYGALALPEQVLIADAAGNDIVRWRDGRLSVFSVLPNVHDGVCAGRPNQNGTTGCDAIPTGLAAGLDGSIYVGAMSGFTPGLGRIFVLDRRTGQITRQITGLGAVNGVAVGPDGSVYASQLFTAFGPTGPDFSTGKVTRIRPDGTRTDTAVPAPAGVAVIGRNLYVSAYSTSPAGGLGQPDSSGQVWRLKV